MPTELWWQILLKSVVDRATLSDSPSSLNESIANHARVCRAWYAVVLDQQFKREAKALLCAKGMLFTCCVLL